MSKPVEILRRMQDIINERGWTKGTYILPTGEVCTIGAYFLARGLTDDMLMHGSMSLPRPSAPGIRSLIQATIDATNDEVDRDAYGVTVFNDRTRTTVEDVHLMIKHAIEIAEAGNVESATDVADYCTCGYCTP